MNDVGHTNPHLPTALRNRVALSQHLGNIDMHKLDKPFLTRELYGTPKVLEQI